MAYIKERGNNNYFVRVGCLLYRLRGTALLISCMPLEKPPLLSHP